MVGNVWQWEKIGSSFINEITEDAREQDLKTCTEQEQVDTYLCSEYRSCLPFFIFLTEKAILNLD